MSGDAVTPAADGTAELLYRACDFGAGVTGVSVEVAGGGTVEVSLADGPPLATLTLGTPTAGPYAYTTLDAPFGAEGVHDLRLRLRGPAARARRLLRLRVRRAADARKGPGTGRHRCRTPSGTTSSRHERAYLKTVPIS